MLGALGAAVQVAVPAGDVALASDVHLQGVEALEAFAVLGLHSLSEGWEGGHGGGEFGVGLGVLCEMRHGCSRSLYVPARDYSSLSSTMFTACTPWTSDAPPRMALATWMASMISASSQPFSSKLLV